MFQTEDLEEKFEAKLTTSLPIYTKGDWVKVSRNSQDDETRSLKLVLPRKLNLEVIQELKIYDDDIYIITPPKCGTTWTQEIVWLMMNNVDTDGAKKNLFYRVPFLELSSITHSNYCSQYPDEKAEKNDENLKKFQSDSVRFINRTSLSRPRIIKTHLPISFLPENIGKKCKIVFVARNVKDATVSYFFHQKLKNYKDDFESFAELVKEENFLQSSYIPMILEAWNLQKTQDNILFLCYEDMKRDLDKELNKLQRFLGQNLSPDKLELLKTRVSFETMKENAHVNKSKEMPLYAPNKGLAFIRKGTVGDWKNYFSEEMNQTWNEWINKKLEATDYKMAFEL